MMDQNSLVTAIFSIYVQTTFLILVETISESTQTVELFYYFNFIELFEDMRRELYHQDLSQYTVIFFIEYAFLFLGESIAIHTRSKLEIFPSLTTIIEMSNGTVKDCFMLSLTHKHKDHESFSFFFFQTKCIHNFA